MQLIAAMLPAVMPMAKSVLAAAVAAIRSLLSKYFVEKFMQNHHRYVPMRQTVSVDEIAKLKKIRKPEFVVFNLDTQFGRGSHWAVLYRNLEGRFEIFDSLGVTPQKKKLLKKWLPKTFSVIYNTTKFQKSDSTRCGMFCLYFIHEKFFNLDLELHELLKTIFSKNLDKNEEKVMSFYQRGH